MIHQISKMKIKIVSSKDAEKVMNSTSIYGKSFQQVGIKENVIRENVSQHNKGHM